MKEFKFDVDSLQTNLSAIQLWYKDCDHASWKPQGKVVPLLLRNATKELNNNDMMTMLPLQDKDKDIEPRRIHTFCVCCCASVEWMVANLRCRRST